MTGYLLGIDAGTTSFKTALYTDEGAAVHIVKEEYVLLTQNGLSTGRRITGRFCAGL